MNLYNSRCAFLPIALLLTSATQAQIVINEVDYDQVSTDSLEYLEIKNIGTSPFPMAMVSVIMYSGASGSPVEYRNISDPLWPELAPGDYFVICTNSTVTANCDAEATPGTNLIENGPMDAIALVLMENPTPLVLDALTYEGTLVGAGEGAGTEAGDTNDSPDVSIGRFPDGADAQDNNADFHLMCISPGAANIIDPVQCDLSTGLGTRAVQVSSFSVLPGPGGGFVMAYDANIASEELTFEVFTADGALVLAKAMGATTRAGWNFNSEPFRGRVLLVRVSTPTRRETRRILLP